MKEQQMSARGPYRRHSQEFKLQLCSDIRDGKLGRREAQKTYRISANLIQLWLNQYDNGELDREEPLPAPLPNTRRRSLPWNARSAS
jgi:transposase-like protein